jgi:hypothetical protein
VEDVRAGVHGLHDGRITTPVSVSSEGLGKTRLLDMAVDFEIVESFEDTAW